MKKYLLGLFAIVLAVGFSAFTAKPASDQVSTDLYWFPAGDQQEPITDVFIEPESSAKLRTGCTQNSTGCEDGYPANQVSVSGENFVASGSPLVTISQQ